MSSSRTDDYLSRFMEIFNLYLQGRLSEAAAAAEALEASHPERKTRIRHGRACIAAMQGERQEALRHMRRVVDDDSWWIREQIADSDLDSVRDTPEFSDLAAAMHRLEKKSVNSAPGGSRVLIRRGPGPIRALVIALHMYGATAEETAEKWEASAIDGLVIAVPESSQSDGDLLPCWNDDGLTERDVLHALEQTQTATPDDYAPVILAGASQGAGQAIRLAFAKRVPGCRGFIAVVGAPPLERLGPTTESSWGDHVRGFLIAGSEDALSRPSQQRLQSELDGRNVPSRLVIVDGLGHQYPSNLTELTHDAVEFILDDAQPNATR